MRLPPVGVQNWSAHVAVMHTFLHHTRIIPRLYNTIRNFVDITHNETDLKMRIVDRETCNTFAWYSPTTGRET